MGFQCTGCRRALPREAPADRCGACGGVLLAMYDLQGIRGRLSRATFDARPPDLLARWAELMPVANPGVLGRVSLGETETPLLDAPRLAAAFGLLGLRLKMDSYLPTGSLKDRPISAVVAGALERCVPVVAISSSGNAGASLAAHAARAGLSAVISVFAGVPAAKLAKMRVYGPAVVQVAGGMDDAEAASRRLCARLGWLNAEAFVNPYNLEGEKTIAYEIARQDRWEPPDAILFPLGNGACLVASYKGFRELRDLGLVDRVPRHIGVQFEACAPIAAAFAEGRSDIAPVRRAPSFSSTLMHEAPLGGRLALEAIRGTGGVAIAVSDAEVRDAMDRLARDAGCFAEPAGAIAVAGAARLAREGVLGARERVVCLVSGSGLNQVDVATRPGRMTAPVSLDAVDGLDPADLTPPRRHGGRT